MLNLKFWLQFYELLQVHKDQQTSNCLGQQMVLFFTLRCYWALEPDWNSKCSLALEAFTSAKVLRGFHFPKPMECSFPRMFKEFYNPSIWEPDFTNSKGGRYMLLLCLLALTVANVRQGCATWQDKTLESSLNLVLQQTFSVCLLCASWRPGSSGHQETSLKIKSHCSSSPTRRSSQKITTIFNSQHVTPAQYEEISK